MFDHESCGKPPDNWGPGVHHVAIPLFWAGSLITGTMTMLGGVYLPFDYDIYGWWYGVGVMTGGTAPVVAFGLHPMKANIATSGFVAPSGLSISSIGSDSGDYVDNSVLPLRQQRSAKDSSWLCGRAVVTTGAGALTALGGLSLGAIIKPISAKTIALT